MNVQKLNTLECIHLTDGAGDSLMHVIKTEKKLYVTRDDEMKAIDANSEHEINREIYEHFANVDGEKVDTRKVLENFKKNSHDWYSLLLCDMLLNELNNAKN